MQSPNYNKWLYCQNLNCVVCDDFYKTCSHKRHFCLGISSYPVAHRQQIIILLETCVVVFENDTLYISQICKPWKRDDIYVKYTANTDPRAEFLWCWGPWTTENESNFWINSITNLTRSTRPGAWFIHGRFIWIWWPATCGLLIVLNATSAL